MICICRLSMHMFDNITLAVSESAIPTQHDCDHPRQAVTAVIPIAWGLVGHSCGRAFSSCWISAYSPPLRVQGQIRKVSRSEILMRSTSLKPGVRSLKVQV